MKDFKIFILFSFLFAIGLTSCTKENVTNEEVTKEETEIETGVNNSLVDNIESRDGENGCVLACFTIDYPFSLDIDGVITEITEETDVEAIVAGAEFVDFVYPFDITYEDGSTVVINDGLELGEAFATCIPDDGWEPNDSINWPENAFPAFLFDSESNGCFDPVYPMNLTDLEGIDYTVNSEAEFIDLLAGVSENDFLFFGYPLAF